MNGFQCRDRNFIAVCCFFTIMGATVLNAAARCGLECAPWTPHNHGSLTPFQKSTIKLYAGRRKTAHQQDASCRPLSSVPRPPPCGRAADLSGNGSVDKSLPLEMLNSSSIFTLKVLSLFVLWQFRGIILAVHSNCLPCVNSVVGTPFYHAAKSLWIFLLSVQLYYRNIEWNDDASIFLRKNINLDI